MQFLLFVLEKEFEAVVFVFDFFNRFTSYWPKFAFILAVESSSYSLIYVYLVNRNPRQLFLFTSESFSFHSAIGFSYF